MGPKQTTCRSQKNFIVPLYEMRPSSVLDLFLKQRTENFCQKDLKQSSFHGKEKEPGTIVGYKPYGNYCPAYHSRHMVIWDILERQYPGIH